MRGCEVGVLPHRKWSSGPWACSQARRGVTRCAGLQQLLALPPRAPSRPLAACLSALVQYLPSFSSAFSSLHHNKTDDLCLCAQTAEVEVEVAAGISRIYRHFPPTRPLSGHLKRLRKRPRPGRIIITQQTQRSTRRSTRHGTRPGPTLGQHPRRRPVPVPRPPQHNATHFPHFGLLLPALRVQVKQPRSGATGIRRHVLRM